MALNPRDFLRILGGWGGSRVDKPVPDHREAPATVATNW